MKNTHRFKVAAAALTAVVMLGGCATISTFTHVAPDYATLPEDAVKSTAALVEKSVKEGNREPVLENTGGLTVNTPEITQAVRTRAARQELISKLLSSGFAVEQKNGLIAVLRSREYKKATTGDERDRNALLVMSENANRWSIYEGIVKASNLSPNALSAVQDAFYRARVELLVSGQKYEDEAGKTVVKP